MAVEAATLAIHVAAGALALVAVFSGYLALSGYRALSRKRPSGAGGTVDRVAAWLWPTAVGVPLIAYWSKKYQTS